MKNLRLFASAVAAALVTILLPAPKVHAQTISATASLVQDGHNTDRVTTDIAWNLDAWKWTGIEFEVTISSMADAKKPDGTIIHIGYESETGGDFDPYLSTEQLAYWTYMPVYINLDGPTHGSSHLVTDLREMTPERPAGASHYRLGYLVQFRAKRMFPSATELIQSCEMWGAWWPY